MSVFLFDLNRGMPDEPDFRDFDPPSLNPSAMSDHGHALAAICRPSAAP
jgi:hypothetical protein